MIPKFPYAKSRQSKPSQYFLVLPQHPVLPAVSLPRAMHLLTTLRLLTCTLFGLLLLSASKSQGIIYSVCFSVFKFSASPRTSSCLENFCRDSLIKLDDFPLTDVAIKYDSFQCVTQSDLVLLASPLTPNR